MGGAQGVGVALDIFDAFLTCKHTKCQNAVQFQTFPGLVEVRLMQLKTNAVEEQLKKLLAEKFQSHGLWQLCGSFHPLQLHFSAMNQNVAAKLLRCLSAPVLNLDKSGRA